MSALASGINFLALTKSTKVELSYSPGVLLLFVQPQNKESKSLNQFFSPGILDSGSPRSGIFCLFLNGSLGM